MDSKPAVLHKVLPNDFKGCMGGQQDMFQITEWEVFEQCIFVAACREEGNEMV